MGAKARRMNQPAFSSLVWWKRGIVIQLNNGFRFPFPKWREIQYGHARRSSCLSPLPLVRRPVTDYPDFDADQSTLDSE
jgi:hypothetical protein